MSKATLESFYVDDGLTGGSNIQETIQLRRQLQDLFSHAGFELMNGTLLNHRYWTLFQQNSESLKGFNQ